MSQLKTREFTNVHVSWIILFDKLDFEDVIETYSILKAYPDNNTLDVICYLKEQQVEKFDKMCCYDGGNRI